MKIAIHHKIGSFSERWIDYCKENNIPFKIVNAYDSNIIEQVKGCDVFMWHHHHADFKDVLTAKKILFALEHAGIKVFPDFKTGWHFDDKIAQKYLLEAINAPLVPSYVFYDKAEALKWADVTSFPKVFKLKGGAGAKNVFLVNSSKDCIKLINRAFSKGFPQYSVFNAVKDDLREFKAKKNFISLIKAVSRFVRKPSFSKLMPNEKGYVYFQDFIPDNNFDIRVIIIGNRAFAIKRMVRENDFRASGSGNLIYNKDEINIECVKVAFSISDRLEAQCLAYDFVLDQNQKPLIVEMSYGFAIKAYDNCPGYWDSGLNWHEGAFNPQEWMMESIVNN